MQPDNSCNSVPLRTTPPGIMEWDGKSWGTGNLLAEGFHRIDL